MTPLPLRIMVLIGQLGLGGSERQLYLLLKHMHAGRFERHVVVFNPSSNYTLDEDLRRAGVVVHAIPAGCKGILRRVVWLYHLVRQVRPHVLHSWSIHDNAYAGLVGALARVPRRLGSVRDSLVSPDFQHFSAPLRWLILHGVHGLLVNSDEIVKELRAAGVLDKYIHMLPNCVELPQSLQGTLPAGLPVEGRLVGMVANLRRKKNIPLFIRGLAGVLPEFPDLYGVIVGQPVLASDPELPGLIQSEIEANNLQGRVLVYGFSADVPSLLHRFEIFCLTSDYEGTPNAILEAMAAGLPVVATHVGGIPRLVQDGVSGFLFPPGDVDALVGALRRLLRDPDLGQQMGLEGRRRVQDEFACQEIARALEGYYLSQFEG